MSAPASSKSTWLDEGIRAAMISVTASALVLAAGAFVAFDVRTAGGVAVGGAFALANLWAFARIGEAFLSRRGKAAPWTAFAMLKLAGLFGGVWLILRTGIASPLSLLVGYGALPIGITLGTMFGPKPPDEVTESDSSLSDGDSNERRSFADDSREDVLKASPPGPEEPPPSKS
ncbi:MAG: ATP synthase subunit I [Polyangiaceae bacterium]|nr:ATP synthase subunit I [Polyangiaceae bacterium]